MSTPSHDGGHDEPVDENLPERDDLYANPGLPEHQWRPTDVDPKAEKRAERQVATLFGLSAICTVLLVVAYFTVDVNDTVGNLGAQNLTLGLCLAGALLFLGFGVIQWARKLMADQEIVEYRHPAASSDEDRAATLEALSTGLAESGIGRRPLVRNSLLGAVGLLGVPAIVFLRDLGPTNAQVTKAQPYPGAGLEHTIWEQGMRVVRDVVGTPIKPGDLQIGDLVNAEPEGLFKSPWDGEPLEGLALQVGKSKGAVVVVRMEPDEIIPGKGRENWSVDGILCYSKICTHVGCPISLYERTTHHLLCPCHQSTFDLADSAKVVFGPAARPLPQLPLAVDSEGYLVAQSDFTEPVGPSYWERG
ncbi:Rieske 2Fe-2S domain-containing protein [Nocardioides sp. LMS-CY]|uniref:Cytochrome bc1 complex Rieske iron-sulfur subunit n=1 Tax=Nocardioides soli TaxID=1036020 RepID=A0A7W4VS83_9ACTN|nr:MULTISPECIES: Rieske 2Fe-2S domain-containing protein [Nocardioides]MBB3040424.1 ubiquinol-cytochrome c reductase iron-sulfur subunit [Nocardioides soli]QWF24097.1 Rieske 2Fe-2S domain-containing protein [Nocardioides sp. LMS-CY]